MRPIFRSVLEILSSALPVMGKADRDKKSCMRLVSSYRAIIIVTHSKGLVRPEPKRPHYTIPMNEREITGLLIVAKIEVRPLTMAKLSPLFKSSQGLANNYTLGVYAVTRN